jgi:hypothetical protein
MPSSPRSTKQILKLWHTSVLKLTEGQLERRSIKLRDWMAGPGISSDTARQAQGENQFRQ